MKKQYKDTHKLMGRGQWYTELNGLYYQVVQKESFPCHRVRLMRDLRIGYTHTISN